MIARHKWPTKKIILVLEQKHSKQKTTAMSAYINGFVRVCKQIQFKHVQATQMYYSNLFLFPFNAPTGTSIYSFR